MTYREAKKLRQGTYIIMKRMDVPMRVTSVRWDNKTVTLEAVDEFNSSLELTHREVRIDPKT